MIKSYYLSWNNYYRSFSIGTLQYFNDKTKKKPKIGIYIIYLINPWLDLFLVFKTKWLVK